MALKTKRISECLPSQTLVDSLASLHTKRIIVLPKQFATTEGIRIAVDITSAAQFTRHFDWVMCDSEGTVNFGAGVSAGALAELRNWAILSLDALDSTQEILRERQLIPDPLMSISDVSDFPP